MQTEKEFLSSEELAVYLGVSKKAIIKWREARRLPGAVRCGRVWRFQRSEIEKRITGGTLLLNKSEHNKPEFHVSFIH